ncbi:MAG: hypothetical protein ACKV2Q_29760 [Planctomycetaceae bacterium]
MSQFELHVNFLITLIEVYSASGKNNRATASNLVASVRNLHFYGTVLQSSIDRKLSELSRVTSDTSNDRKIESIRDAVVCVEVVVLQLRVIELELNGVDVANRVEKKRVEATVASLFNRIDQLAERLRQILKS